MTILIPAGTDLVPADLPGGPMRVVDDSTAEIVAFDHGTGPGHEILTVKFEDGEEYTVRAAHVGAGRIYENPGANVTSRNGVRCSGSVSCGGGC